MWRGRRVALIHSNCCEDGQHPNKSRTFSLTGCSKLRTNEVVPATTLRPAFFSSPADTEAVTVAGSSDTSLFHKTNKTRGLACITIGLPG